MSRRDRRKGRRKNPYARADRFTKEAKDAGYAARSVFKLREIDRRTQLFQPGDRVVDLGCHPGSWSRYAHEAIGPRGALVGVDLEPTQGIPATFLARSAMKVSAEELRDALGGDADVLISDMAPRTTGDRFGDHVRQIALCERARDLALELLLPGGHFVCKVFDGQDAKAFVDSLRPHFERTRRLKPEATRNKSVEFFVIGLDRKALEPPGWAPG